MNPRIELVGDDYVIIHGRTKTEVRCKPTSLHIGYFESGDAAAIEALTLVLNCYSQTGSFAGLADSSPEKFTGKRMVESGNRNEPLVTLLHPTKDGRWYCEYPSGSIYSCLAADLRPIVPKPKYRPLTPEEAVKHLCRGIITDREVRESWIMAVYINGIGLPDDVDVTYEYALNNYKWADTGEPCGVKIESEDHA